jgi:hypothetical protein
LEHSHRYGRKERVAKTYQLDTLVSPSSLLARARRAARENGATLVGDEGSGRFSHELVRGEYRMAGQRVVVTITDKHWLLPWPVVEVRLRELLASA